MSQPQEGGAGVVNCQFGAATYEKFILRAQDPDQFSIGSLLFPNVFLRLDGRQVTSYQGSGSGVVNSQFGRAMSYEKFVLRQDGHGQYTIQSAPFPNAFLRMDGSKVTSYNGAGSGVVNAQFGARSYEKFKIHDL